MTVCAAILPQWLPHAMAIINYRAVVLVGSVKEGFQFPFACRMWSFAASWVRDSFYKVLTGERFV